MEGHTMYSISSRFTNNADRMLTPMEKLQECVGLLLDGRLGVPEYRQVLGQIYECVENAHDQLSQVEFPPAYDAGPVLMQYAHTALASFEESLANLQELGDSMNKESAKQNLAQARESYDTLADVLKEVQNERYNY
jgi:hypothetical protein